MIESVRTSFEHSSNIRSNQSGGRKPPGQTGSTTASTSQPRQYYNQANRRPHSQHKRQNDRRYVPVYSPNEFIIMYIYLLYYYRQPQ